MSTKAIEGIKLAFICRLIYFSSLVDQRVIGCTNTLKMVIRIPVTIHGVPEKFLIVSVTGDETIQWLCETAYQRCRERYRDRIVSDEFMARRAADRCLLSPTDRIKETLVDNEPVQIGELE